MLRANLQLHVVVNAPIDFIRKYEYDRGKSEKSVHLQDTVWCIHCTTGILNYSRFPSDTIEWFIEDQAFSPSYDLAPPQVTSTDLSQEDWKRKTTWGEGMGEEPSPTTAIKTGPL